MTNYSVLMELFEMCKKTHPISWQDLKRATEFGDVLKFKCAVHLKIFFPYMFLNFLMVLTTFHMT